MRTCIFCSNKATTKEDVWPKWLMRHYPTSVTAPIYAERDGQRLGNRSTSNPTVKFLCDSCNSGWMSRLEEKTKSILEPILDDKLDNLNANDQLTIARWAVKIAMVIEAVNPKRPNFYSQDERQLMYTKLYLPQHTWVWIAKCIEQPNIYIDSRDLRTSSHNDGYRGFSTTMAFVYLAIQVLSIKNREPIPKNLNLTYNVSEGPWDWDQTLLQVWPNSQNSLTWPPHYGLDGEFGLNKLTNRFI